MRVHFDVIKLFMRVALSNIVVWFLSEKPVLVKIHQLQIRLTLLLFVSRIGHIVVS